MDVRRLTLSSGALRHLGKSHPGLCSLHGVSSLIFPSDPTPSSSVVPITLHSLSLYLCRSYWTCVKVDTRSVFLPYWLRPSFLLLSSRLVSSPVPARAELVMEPIDWLAVGPIDPQGHSAAYWRMFLQCPPLRRLIPLLLYPLCSMSSLLNLSLTSFRFSPAHSTFIPAILLAIRLSFPSLTHPSSLSFIDAVQIDAEDNGRRPCGEPVLCPKVIGCQKLISNSRNALYRPVFTQFWSFGLDQTPKTWKNMQLPDQRNSYTMSLSN